MTKRQPKSSRRNVRRFRSEMLRRRARRAQQISELARAFNEWMRRYIDEPDRFSREFETVIAFCRQIGRRREPSYGRECAEYLLQLIEET